MFSKVHVETTVVRLLRQNAEDFLIKTIHLAGIQPEPLCNPKEKEKIIEIHKKRFPRLKGKRL